MNIAVESLEGGIVRVALSGRMDIDGTQEIELRLAAEASVDRISMIVDLSNVTFMSSIGIGVLVSTAKAVRRRNGGVVLLNPQPIVALVLERTQIDALMPVYTSLEEAVKEFSKNRAGV